MSDSDEIREGSEDESLSTPMLFPDMGILSLHVRFTIPEKVIRNIDLKDGWKGHLPVQIMAGSSRTAKISKLEEKSIIRRRYTPLPEFRQLAAAWNRLCDQPPYVKGQRNRVFELKNLWRCDDALRYLLKLHTVDELIKLMEMYQVARQVGRCYWNMMDHSYLTMSGWSQGLRNVRKSGNAAFWEEVSEISIYNPDRDKHADLTLLVADAFAQLVLNLPEYGERDNNWLQFQAVAERISAIRADIETKVAIPVFVRMLIRCAITKAERLGDATIYPKMLCSNMLWEIELPQFLKNNIPGLQLPKR